ncbi:MAG: NAD(P)-dependent oxidoreductase, partial [Shinella sp.]
RVLVTVPFLPKGHLTLEPFTTNGIDVIHGTSRNMTTADWTALVASVDGAIVGSDPFSAPILAAAPRLRAVARGGVGYDAIDVPAATANGVAICIHAGLNQRAVAELALTLMLAALRRLPENLADYAAAGWKRLDGLELTGATVGIVGLGRIGKRLIQLLAPFEVTVLAHDAWQDEAFAKTHGVNYVSAEELLARSDVISLHMPLTPETRGWLNSERLSLMKPSASVVNTSRGEVVDQDALAAALAAKTIAGAALDVAVGEPLAIDHPLRSFPNVLLTPHVGGATEQARDLGGSTAVRNVLAILTGGSTPDVINPEYTRHLRQASTEPETLS